MKKVTNTESEHKGETEKNQVQAQKQNQNLLPLTEFFVGTEGFSCRI